MAWSNIGIFFPGIRCTYMMMKRGRLGLVRFLLYRLSYDSGCTGEFLWLVVVGLDDRKIYDLVIIC